MKTQKYFSVDFEKIPDGAIFYALNNEGKQLKCKKIGRYGLSYKDKVFTIKRYCPFPKNWYYVVCTRTYNRIESQ